MRGVKFTPYGYEDGRAVLQPEFNAEGMEDPIADDTLLDVMHWLGFGDNGAAYFRALEDEQNKIFNRAMY